MASLNEVYLIGNLGKDAEVKDVTGGRLAQFPIATTERYTTASGEKKESTEWHNIVLWGKGVDAIGRFLVKGKQVCVRGSIKTRSWETESGEKRYRTEIKAHRVELLGSNSEPAAPLTLGSPVREEDDIPF